MTLSNHAKNIKDHNDNVKSKQITKCLKQNDGNQYTKKQSILKYNILSLENSAYS